MPPLIHTPLMSRTATDVLLIIYDSVSTRKNNPHVKANNVFKQRVFIYLLFIYLFENQGTSRYTLYDVINLSFSIGCPTRFSSRNSDAVG